MFCIFGWGTKISVRLRRGSPQNVLLEKVELVALQGGVERGEEGLVVVDVVDLQQDPR